MLGAGIADIITQSVARRVSVGATAVILVLPTNGTAQTERLGRMRLIDADELTNWIHSELRQAPNGVFNSLNGRQAANLIAKAAYEIPTVGKEIADAADALECFRRQITPNGIVCEQTKCKWRCNGREMGLDNGYCAFNNLLADTVRLLGGEPGKEVILRDKAD